MTKNVLLDWNDFWLNNYKTLLIPVAKWYLLTYFLFQYKFDHTKVYATPSKGQDFVSYLTVLSFFLWYNISFQLQIPSLEAGTSAHTFVQISRYFCARGRRTQIKIGLSRALQFILKLCRLEHTMNNTSIGWNVLSFYIQPVYCAVYCKWSWRNV